ncbi:MAG: ATP-dependent DNA helicase, partial [Comamonadaceae bacterium]
RCLIAQAPTGIGKTLATTFPLLRGWSAQQTDKLFFLSAKTSGRAVALEALERLARPAPALRIVELTAREKLCEHPGRACHGDDCPLARGFYDRLPGARAEAVAVHRLDGSALRDVARRHAVCPYFLSQEMVRWSDVVVADYNYWFDGSAFLHALTKQEEWQVAVLVDEAHNLLERARAMYSAPLDAVAFEAARALATGALRAPLQRVGREWQALQQAQPTDYQAHERVPERLQQALQDAVAVLAEHFAERPQAAGGPLQRFFFDALQFLRLANSLGDHSVFDSTLASDQAPSSLAVRNLVPAPFLQPRFAAAATTVCFSGTIAPFGFYRDMLGMPGRTVELEVDSPFEARQLAVRIVTDLSTRLRDRSRAVRPLVDLMSAQFERQPGNYLAFFSSFEFLEQARTLFAALHPGVPVWTQTAAMRENEREAFVARFRT